jgi:hypothetical protein
MLWVVLVLALVWGSTRAARYRTWTGSSLGQWHAEDRWSDAALPCARDGAVFSANAGAILLAGNGTATSLTFKPKASVLMATATALQSNFLLDADACFLPPPPPPPVATSSNSGQQAEPSASPLPLAAGAAAGVFVGILLVGLAVMFLRERRQASTSPGSGAPATKVPPATVARATTATRVVPMQFVSPVFQPATGTAKRSAATRIAGTRDSSLA